MRTIALVLGDNDYGNTFRPLLESLARAIEWNGELTPASVEVAIRAGIEFHYRVFQLEGEARGACSAPDAVARTVEYLKQKVRILFDEVAEADILGPGHDSGAWYLELATGKVYHY